MVGVQWHPEDTAARRSRHSRPSSTGSAIARAGGEGPEPSPARRRGGRAPTASSTTTPPGRRGSTEEASDPPRGARPDSRSAIDHVGSTSVPGLGGEAGHRHPGVGGVTRSRGSPSSTRSWLSATSTASTRSSRARVLQPGYDDDGSAARARPRLRGRQRVGAQAPRVPRRAPSATRDGAAEYGGPETPARRRASTGHLHVRRREDGLHPVDRGTRARRHVARSD